MKLTNAKLRSLPVGEKVAEVGDYDQMLAEIALSRKQEKRVEAAYQRSNLADKRRAMIKDYAKFATSATQQQRMIGH